MHSPRKETSVQLNTLAENSSAILTAHFQFIHKFRNKLKKKIHSLSQIKTPSPNAALYKEKKKSLVTFMYLIFTSNGIPYSLKIFTAQNMIECDILHTCDYIKLSDSSTELNTSCIMQDKCTQVLLKLSPLLCVSLASFETAIHTVVLNTDD